MFSALRPHCCPSCVIVTRPFRYAPTSVCTSSRGAARSLSSLSQTPLCALRDSNSHFIFDLELERGPGKVTLTTNPEVDSCACVRCLNCSQHQHRVICFANSQAVKLDVDSRIGCIGKPVTCDTLPSFGANSLLIAEQHAGNESKFINDGICLYVTSVV